MELKTKNHLFEKSAGKSSSKLMTEHNRAMLVAKNSLRKYNA